MIKSMTGFGRCETAEDHCRYTVEIKAVNHRYLDLNLKMPKKLNLFETQIRNVLKEYLQRGKADIFITCEDIEQDTASVRYNRTMAEKYLNYLRQMASDFSLEDDIRVSTISRFPEVFTLEEARVDEEGIWKVLERTLRQAAERFVETRVQEGEHLRGDLLGKLRKLETCVAFIERRSPVILEEYRQKLTDRVRELLADAQVEESRLLTEVAIFADKVCVDEEIVRLRSHIQTMKDTLLAGGSIGRKLDFLAQELNREANTILSKSTDLEISNCGIELKTEIEKIREQIQNIE